uniref:Uncharacterized protein n=1 Tax=Anopheles merus TaxID=30066 RepID=A0A182UQ62_ANOME
MELGVQNPPTSFTLLRFSRTARSGSSPTDALKCSPAGARAFSPRATSCSWPSSWSGACCWWGGCTTPAGPSMAGPATTPTPPGCSAGSSIAPAPSRACCCCCCCSPPSVSSPPTPASPPPPVSGFSRKSSGSSFRIFSASFTRSSCRWMSSSPVRPWAGGGAGMKISGPARWNCLYAFSTRSALKLSGRKKNPPKQTNPNVERTSRMRHFSRDRNDRRPSSGFVTETLVPAVPLPPPPTRCDVGLLHRLFRNGAGAAFGQFARLYLVRIRAKG